MRTIQVHTTFVLISLMLLILYAALSISPYKFLNVICTVCELKFYSILSMTIDNLLLFDKYIYSAVQRDIIIVE